MIEINLLPGAGKKKAARQKAVDFGAMAAGLTGRLKDKFMIGAIASLVVSGAFIGLFYTRQDTR
ncbi:MAG: hypothetical protein ACREPM_00840, partial [Gemmatimonadaceae bacterium]